MERKLINDSYNSSPAALHAMTALLAATPGFQRRILAAGEMRELGTASAELHREAGAAAAKSAKSMGSSRCRRCRAESSKAPSPRASIAPKQNSPSSEDCRHVVQKFFQPGDLCLSGFARVKMERIARLVAAHASTEHVARRFA